MSTAEEKTTKPLKQSFFEVDLQEGDNPVLTVTNGFRTLRLTGENARKLKPAFDRMADDGDVNLNILYIHATPQSWLENHLKTDQVCRAHLDKLGITL